MTILGDSFWNFFLFLLGANVEGMRTGRVDNRNMRNTFKRIKN
jgi:hypothetical protein